MIPGKGKGKGKRRGKAKGRGVATPGILESWEDWNEEGLRDLIDSIARDAGEELDRLEQAMRGTN